MWIEIVEFVHLTSGSQLQSRRAVIPHLHDNHDRLGYQRPTTPRKSWPNIYAEFPDRRHGFAAPDRNTLAMVAAVHVDSDHAAERRLEQRQPARPRQVARTATTHDHRVILERRDRLFLGRSAFYNGGRLRPPVPFAQPGPC